MLLEKIVNEVERVLRKASSDSNQQPTIREDDVPLEGERFEDG